MDKRIKIIGIRLTLAEYANIKKYAYLQNKSIS